MFEKETKDAKYRDDPYRAVNFRQDEKGKLLCPEGRKFKHDCDRPIKEPLRQNRGNIQMRELRRMSKESRMHQGKRRSDNTDECGADENP